MWTLHAHQKLVVESHYPVISMSYLCEVSDQFCFIPLMSDSMPLNPITSWRASDDGHALKIKLP